MDDIRCVVTYYDKDNNYMTVGLMSSLGFICVELTIDDWNKWLEAQIKECKKTEIPSAFKKEFTN